MSEKSPHNPIPEPSDQQYKYAYRTTYLLCAFVFVAAVCHALQLFRQIRPKHGAFMYRLPFIPRLVGLIRGISYYHFRGNRYFHLPALKSCILITSFFIAMVAWIFSIKPYYRESLDNDGLPPLAIRSCMTAIAFYPFIFACALKVNPISFLTGISHARLQIYHQFFAFMMFFFGLVHAIAFLSRISKERGYAGVKDAYAEGNRYWTGTVSICLVAWILCSSLGVFRNFSYRFFVVQHILSVMLLLGFLFTHVSDDLGARFFLWAGVAFWIFSIVIRGCMVLFSSNFFTGNMAQVDIQVVSNLPLTDEKPLARGSETVQLSFTTLLRWKPGQHVYVRFPGVAIAQAHPFTVMSLPSKEQKKSKLMLLAKVQEGTTRKLFNYVRDYSGVERSFANEINTKPKPNLSVTNSSDPEKNWVAGGALSRKSVSTEVEIAPAVQKAEIQSARVVAFLDGPYGYTMDPASYEQVLFFAGGTGVSYVLPIAMQLMRRCAEQDPRVLTKRIRFVWTAHTTGLVGWLADELATILEYKKTLPISIELSLCVTGEVSGSRHKSFVQTVINSYGVRPNIQDIVQEEVSLAMSDGTTSLASYVCGPGSMAHDLSNVMAHFNLDLARGRLGSLRDVYLDVEHFNW
ncbi:hypothetical protein MYAM1_003158 [Malassezia yamatoensis]|uniref:ferric-chelate reductase (NADPH) n=1 Tax=Malassezia yamatoensis TaxID=253288 RepID=A0AAJ6CJ29_9BASI|nr:hypothetical protein MYAM1_003158 [Malassezia yamatoensis]